MFLNERSRSVSEDLVREKIVPKSPSLKPYKKETCRDVLSVDDLTDHDIGRIFYHARTMRESGFLRYQKEKAVLLTAFFEASTRTRLSFEMAAHRLGMRVCAIHAESSSLKKGETENLTITNLLSLRP